LSRVLKLLIRSTGQRRFDFSRVIGCYLFLPYSFLVFDESFIKRKNLVSTYDVDGKSFFPQDLQTSPDRRCLLVFPLKPETAGSIPLYSFFS